MESKYFPFFGVGVIVPIIDQVIKIYVHYNFELHESIEVIPGFFSLTYVRNPGAAFGFLADSHSAFREIFFLSMPPAALLIILMILRGIDRSNRLMIFSLGLIFGGAIGNYTDRLKHRFVVDFLDFHWQRKFTWPAFNTADIAIVSGVSILLLLEITKKKANHWISVDVPANETGPDPNSTTIAKRDREVITRAPKGDREK